jgi:hypothetical protein
VPQVGFAPDWTKHAKAAPFKRNDAMLDVLPIGVIVFPGTGIQDNLADKARKLGIPLRLPPEGRRRVSAVLSKPSPAEVDLIAVVQIGLRSTRNLTFIQHLLFGLSQADNNLKSAWRLQITGAGARQRAGPDRRELGGGAIYGGGQGVRIFI